MKIIVGLGNPGKKYEQTRHNMGFITIDRLAKKHGIRVNKLKFKALTGEGEIAGEKVLLVKPQTFMNLSGRSVREVVAFYKAEMQDLIVVYDDIDTEVGRLRVRKQGSAGTHNGMKSVIYELQEDDFTRIRIGIGAAGEMDLAAYVLSGFTKPEVPLLEEAVDTACLAIETIIADGVDMAMNRYNTRTHED